MVKSGPCCNMSAMTYTSAAASGFRADHASAREMDAADPLAWTRELFHIPRAAKLGAEKATDEPAVYMTGNSLGLMPKAAKAAVEQELEDWAMLAVEAHLHGRDPWLPYHEWLREPAARLVAAAPGECVMMNSLTVNLHLLMVSFYRPTRERYKIIIEDTAFPSDSYAVASQLRFHGFDPREGLVRIRAKERPSAVTQASSPVPQSGRTGETPALQEAAPRPLMTEEILEVIQREGRRTALVLLGAVNYLTGQWFDMPRITAAAKKQGCVVGWDLAHAAGNVPMRLHDWDVDFAAWCTYKYLNGGPGAVAGAFVHERHAKSFDLPRFAGWWGNDPATRFAMGPEFIPREGADGWQLSNPPIFSMAPVKASMQIFDQVGMEAIRAKSLKLTGYLEYLLDQRCVARASSPSAEQPRNGPEGGAIHVVTPRDPAQRGAQLSLRLPGIARDAEACLRRMGVVVDFREPDIIRVAPAPLYNSFHDVWRLAQALRSIT